MPTASKMFGPTLPIPTRMHFRGFFSSEFLHLISKFKHKLDIDQLKKCWSHVNLSKNQVKKCCSLKLNRYLDRCIYRDLKCETQQIRSTAVSIKNYKNQCFKFDFTHIYVYLYKVSFFITLDIYKDYFKGSLI